MVVAIIAILASLLLPALVRAKDKAKRIACMSNLRQLAYMYHMYNMDFDNHLPTAAMLGYSSYRSVNDPLSLCHYFEAYAPTNSRVWICPAGRPASADRYGVTYAWSRAQNVTSTATSDAAFDSMMTTVVVWDNFTYTLPSVFGVPESPTAGGPSAVAAYLRYYPHDGKSKANYLYLDGRTYTR